MQNRRSGLKSIKEEVLRKKASCEEAYRKRQAEEKKEAEIKPQPKQVHRTPKKQVGAPAEYRRTESIKEEVLRKKRQAEENYAKRKAEGK